MGAGASTDVAAWSKEDVGEQVASLGETYEQYKDIALKEGIDGEQLLDFDDEDLEEAGVTKKIHRKNIRKTSPK